jgi:hypothetical protein
MKRPDDWEAWADRWRGGGNTAPLNDVRELVARDLRRLRRARIAARAVPAAGILGVLAALGHAHDLPDIVTAAITIAGLAALLLRRDAASLRASLAEPTAEFIASTAARNRRALRALHLVRLAVVLDLVFFAPWWVSGFATHRGELDGPLMLAAWWFPMLTIVALLAWTVVAAARLRDELRRLDAIAAAHSER